MVVLCLPMEIVTDIFCRLPVKALLRFRCASNEFCSLIDHPDFVKLHLKYSKSHESEYKYLSLIVLRHINNTDMRFFYLLDMDTMKGLVELKSPLRPNPSIFPSQVLGSCNGFVCLDSNKGYALTQTPTNGEELVLWNPSIRKHWMLPLPPKDFQQNPDSKFKFSGYSRGFGYDSIHDDYKLVWVLVWKSQMNDYVYNCQILVYSLKNDIWRKVEFQDRAFAPKTYKGVFFGGAIHWFNNITYERKRKYIVAFDVVAEEIRFLTLMEEADQEHSMGLGVLGECLSATVYNDYTRNFDIWVMKEYGVKSSWTKLVSVSNLSSSLSPIPLAYSRSGMKVLMKNGRELFWCELKKQVSTKLRNFEEKPKNVYCYDGELCLMNSLITVNASRASAYKEKEMEQKKEEDEKLKE
ncbi:putative F-box family protein [Quillaja saponaria]|uniref:F-box family protein n=1 Tax=Quillaja saponaria TaxID=32244 RepID=A0AAD7KVG8_QUISA|nr:putative F-box family protein [Quillaja saponaria]